MRKQTIAQWTRISVQQTINRLVDSITSAIEGRVKVTSSDSTLEFLDDKVSPGRGLTRTVLNPGVAEQYQLDAVSAEHELVVDPSGNFDETSIAVAIDAAVAGGASAADPWLVTVKPGVYMEPPMTVPAGVAVVSEANRIDTVFVVADNAGADLFTCTGGYLAGMSLSGVSDASHALIRCATAASLVVLHGMSWRNCSSGLIVENGASTILTNCSVPINGAGQGIDDAIICRGAGSFLGVTGLFISVPTAVLVAYPGVNPIQRCVTVTGVGAAATISNMVLHVDYNVADNDGVLADDGAFVVLFAADVEDCYYATRIGPNGADTQIIVQGASFFDNDWNGQADSATSIYQVSAEADAMKFGAVAGAQLNGVILVSGVGETLIAGAASYLYASGKQTSFGEFIHDASSTGASMGGVTTDAGGLTVDETAGEGYSTRHGAFHDTETVTWDAASGVVLTDDATNYVYYDPVTDSVIANVAAPGVDKVLLADVITESGAIIYIHDTRREMMQPPALIHDYLLSTRRIAWESGVVVTPGTVALRNLDVDPGSWYRAWSLLSVAGGSDVAWSYYYGSGGGLTRVAAVTQVDIDDYDLAGTLTGMTAGWYRADTAIITSDNEVTLIYGTEQFATPAEAEDTANKAVMPDFLAPTGCYMALVVVQEGSGIASIIDIRPNPNAATAGGGGGAGTNDHSALSNLPNDDHLQYLRTDGTRVATGSLNMGGNQITNVGNVDGVDVSAHAARHQTGGPDAIPVATPVLDGLMSAADKVAVNAIAASYGEIYLSTPTPQAGLSGTPATLTTFNANGVALDSTSDQANNRVTVGTTGNYKVSFNISFTGNNNGIYTFEVAVNGVAQTNGVVKRKLGVGTDVGACGFDCLLSLTAAQQVTVQVSTTGTSLTAESCVMNVVKL